MRPTIQTFSHLVRRVLPVWILALCACPAAFNQAGRGGINGLITDSMGAAIPRAKVTAVDVSNGVSRSTVATGAGFYSFVSLDPATYRVTATANGFETVTHDQVIVSVDQTSEVNITLKVGSASE